MLSFLHQFTKLKLSTLTRLQVGLQAENQLSGLHVEDADLPVCEGCDQMSGVAAHQVHGGGNSHL